MSITVWLFPISPLENPTLHQASELVVKKIASLSNMDCHTVDPASLKAKTLPLWNEWNENSRYRTSTIADWSMQVLYDFGVPAQDIKLIVTDVELEPSDMSRRYEIYVTQRTPTSQVAVISLAVLDPRYWFEVGYEPRIKKIVRRLYAVCLRIIGLQFGLDACQVTSCPMVHTIESITTIDKMTGYCPLHILGMKARQPEKQSISKSADDAMTIQSSQKADDVPYQIPRKDSFQRPLRIFLCHASGDKPIVRKLYHRLKTDGLDPWLDEENLLAGQEWQIEILKAVRNADIVIVCLSRQSVNKTGYLQKEIRHILDVADEQPEGTIFLIPLRLEECQVPERLNKWQWVNFFEEDSYERLMRSIQTRAETLEGNNPK